jgi:hypothetical protein
MTFLAQAGWGLFVLAGGGGEVEGTHTCPNTKASQVDARTESLGDVDTCGFGFVIFGVGGGIFGDDCPEFRLFYPAHQVCRGEPAAGMHCVPSGALAVQKEECECGGLVLPLIELGIPTECVCTDDPAGGGTVEDATTQACFGG